MQNQKFILELHYKEDGKELFIPFHPRDITQESKCGETPLIKIEAVVWPKEFETWGKLLGSLPVGPKIHNRK